MLPAYCRLATLERGSYPDGTRSGQRGREGKRDADVVSPERALSTDHPLPTLISPLKTYPSK